MSKTYTLREAKLILRNRALKKTIATLRDQLSTMRSAFLDIQEVIRNNDKDAEIAKLNARIAELEAAQRWIPVPQSPEVQE